MPDLPTPSKQPGYIRALASMWWHRRESPLYRRRCLTRQERPVPGGRVLAWLYPWLLALLGVPIGMLAFGDGVSAAILFTAKANLVLCPIACMMLATAMVQRASRLGRSRHRLEDLWLSGLAPREIAFATFYPAARMVFDLCLAFYTVSAAGLYLVHLEDGWQNGALWFYVVVAGVTGPFVAVWTLLLAIHNSLRSPAGAWAPVVWAPLQAGLRALVILGIVFVLIALRSVVPVRGSEDSLSPALLILTAVLLAVFMTAQLVRGACSHAGSRFFSEMERDDLARISEDGGRQARLWDLHRLPEIAAQVHTSALRVSRPWLPYLAGLLAGLGVMLALWCCMAALWPALFVEPQAVPLLLRLRDIALVSPISCLGGALVAGQVQMAVWRVLHGPRPPLEPDTHRPGVLLWILPVSGFFVLLGLVSQFLWLRGTDSPLRGVATIVYSGIGAVVLLSASWLAAVNVRWSSAVLAWGFTLIVLITLPPAALLFLPAIVGDPELSRPLFPMGLLALEILLFLFALFAWIFLGASIRQDLFESLHGRPAAAPSRRLRLSGRLAALATAILFVVPASWWMLRPPASPTAVGSRVVIRFIDETGAPLDGTASLGNAREEEGTDEDGVCTWYGFNPGSAPGDPPHVFFTGDSGKTVDCGVLELAPEPACEQFTVTVRSTREPVTLQLATTEGYPLAGVPLDLMRDHTPPRGRTYLFNDIVPAGCTTTDESGAFRLVPGNWFLTGPVTFGAESESMVPLWVREEEQSPVEASLNVVRATVRLVGGDGEIPRGDTVVRQRAGYNSLGMEQRPVSGRFTVAGPPGSEQVFVRIHRGAEGALLAVGEHVLMPMTDSFDPILIRQDGSVLLQGRAVETGGRPCTNALVVACSSDTTGGLDEFGYLASAPVAADGSFRLSIPLSRGCLVGLVTTALGKQLFARGCGLEAVQPNGSAVRQMTVEELAAEPFLTLVAAPHATCRGRVVDEKGVPVAGAQVEALMDSQEGMWSDWKVRATAESGPDGSFMLQPEGVPLRDGGSWLTNPLAVGGGGLAFRTSRPQFMLLRSRDARGSTGGSAAMCEADEESVIRLAPPCRVRLLADPRGGREAITVEFSSDVRLALKQLPSVGIRVTHVSPLETVLEGVPRGATVEVALAARSGLPIRRVVRQRIEGSTEIKYLVPAGEKQMRRNSPLVM